MEYRQEHSNNIHRFLKPRPGYFDAGPLHLIQTFTLKNDILIFYSTQKPFSLGALYLNEHESVVWRTPTPIWQSQKPLKAIGIQKEHDHYHFTYQEKKRLQNISFKIDCISPFNELKLAALKRVPENPILRPDPAHSWESSAVFNAAALFLENKVHFIYRAITQNGASVLGYAESSDGILITKRSDTPIFQQDIPPPHLGGYQEVAFPFPYQSGESFIGSEDPRLTHIEDKIYMTYTAFEPHHPPSVALSSIRVEDFLAKNWNWSPPTRISPPCEQHKNWVIFPEKINGKYAILHSITPKISIEYFDSLCGTSLMIKSRYARAKESMYWDNWLRGAGPPPIKTPEGWLVFYHAMDINDPNKYKLGAMVLSLDDPTEILYRAPYPILEPKALYENEGYKEGVVYACGAVLIEDNIFVYYGAADTVLCAATIKLDMLLKGLKNAKITPRIKFIPQKRAPV